MLRERKSISLSMLAALLLLAAGAYAANGPVPADQSLATFKIAEGLECKLWASEPGMSNPTNIDIDSRGRIWVCEAVNYRKYMLRPEGDRIMILEDTDGDGVCDSYKVFAQDPNIRAPLGICVLGNKVYVSQSPVMLVYTIDESGDKPAGPPEVLFSGFSGVNHDHGLHAVSFGPDGRFYFNSGNEGLWGGGNTSKDPLGRDSSGIIKNSKGERVVDSTGSEIGAKATLFRGQLKKSMGYTNGMAFRCNPDGSGFETLGYNFRNNYEVAVDSFGTAWQSDNDDDGNQGVRINYVMEGGNYGYVGQPSGSNWVKDMPRYPGQTKQEGHWHQRDPGVVPNLLITGGGSPTGICVYEGDLLPEKYRGALLHCDAGPNVVRAYITSPNGAGYKAESVDLIKATDRWFRPADVCVAPDGAVYVADWYDPGVGGHEMGDRKAGEQRGRIFRLAPPGYKPSKPKLDLSNVSGQVAALCSPCLATRYLGYTKLNESGAAAVEELSKLNKLSPDARMRARAQWLLARSPGGEKFVSAALKDANTDIRVTAIRAARMLKMDMISVAKQMLNDASPAVLREICLAMNYEPTDKCMDVLVALADKIELSDLNENHAGASRWYIEAFGIASTGREKEVLEAWTKNGKNKEPKLAEVLKWRLNKIIPDLPPPPPQTAKKDEKKDEKKPESKPDAAKKEPEKKPEVKAEPAKS